MESESIQDMWGKARAVAHGEKIGLLELAYLITHEEIWRYMCSVSRQINVEYMFQKKYYCEARRLPDLGLVGSPIGPFLYLTQELDVQITPDMNEDQIWRAYRNCNVYKTVLRHLYIKEDFYIGDDVVREFSVWEYEVEEINNIVKSISGERGLPYIGEVEDRWSLFETMPNKLWVACDDLAVVHKQHFKELQCRKGI